VTEDLGVVQQTVSRARDELPESVKRTQLSKVNTDEKREQVREFVEDTPDKPGTRRPVSPRVLGDSQRYSAGVWALGSRAPSGGSPGTQARIQRSLQPTPHAVKQSKIQAGHSTPRTRRGVATRRGLTSTDF
jgi:hypothetical protein